MLGDGSEGLADANDTEMFDYDEEKDTEALDKDATLKDDRSADNERYDSSKTTTTTDESSSKSSEGTEKK